eukprot:GHVT01033346.1.p1 GENE.GHVT01033346.1~~GHVT01033346.1.p1  ORF type:complete len:120 (+),score=7.04 GHVT01033346.1:630-989(+)
MGRAAKEASGMSEGGNLQINCHYLPLIFQLARETWHYHLASSKLKRKTWKNKSERGHFVKFIASIFSAVATLLPGRRDDQRRTSGVCAARSRVYVHQLLALGASTPQTRRHWGRWIYSH